MACAQLQTLQNQRSMLIAAQPGLEAATAAAKLAQEQNRVALAIVDIEIAICQQEGLQIAETPQAASQDARLKRLRAYAAELNECMASAVWPSQRWINGVEAVLKKAPR